MNDVSNIHWRRLILTNLHIYINILRLLNLTDVGWSTRCFQVRLEDPTTIPASRAG